MRRGLHLLGADSSSGGGTPAPGGGSDYAPYWQAASGVADAASGSAGKSYAPYLSAASGFAKQMAAQKAPPASDGTGAAPHGDASSPPADPAKSNAVWYVGVAAGGVGLSVVLWRILRAGKR